MGAVLQYMLIINRSETLAFPDMNHYYIKRCLTLYMVTHELIDTWQMSQ